MANSDYRACVCAVFTNEHGQVLVGERREPHGAWQFPQGGIDPGESPEAAARREAREEVGCGEVVIIARAAASIRYHFPPDAKGPLVGRFRGQDQIWFRLEFAPGAAPDLAKATDNEFVTLAWITPDEALRRVVDFKRSAYLQGLTQLGLLHPNVLMAET